ncbi:MAG: DPP IV N-terminal domain-containing protein, partial [Anaerolineae bacterium]|nr:DPP IV N-terminal domain-containing protein [Anaerolineae bacterium]
GLLHLDSGDFDGMSTIAEYVPVPQSSVVWNHTLSQADEGHLVTVWHGGPYADETPENSIVFDVVVINVETGLIINPFKAQGGIWANPSYSPMIEGPDGNPTYQVAYFQAREPLNSPGAAGYNLIVADRDGSNARIVFPDPERPGIRAPDPEDGIVWSPTGRQIALIYQDNLWIIEPNTGQAYQITSDGQASRPRWSATR